VSESMIARRSLSETVFGDEQPTARRRTMRLRKDICCRLMTIRNDVHLELEFASWIPSRCRHLFYRKRDAPVPQK
jgi:hypothetical protein